MKMGARCTAPSVLEEKKSSCVTLRTVPSKYQHKGVHMSFISDHCECGTQVGVVPMWVWFMLYVIVVGSTVVTASTNSVDRKKWRE